MRFQRLLTLILGVALLGAPALVAGAAPSHAGVAAIESRVVILETTGAKQLYGRDYQVLAQLQGYNTSAEEWQTLNDPAQNLVLQRRLAGQASWTSVATGPVSSSNATVVFTTKAVANAAYRVHYAGGTLSGGSTQISPSTSAAKALKVFRNLGAKSKKAGRSTFSFYGKVSPKYKGKITIQRNTGGKWKNFATTRTNNKSAWSVRVPAKPTDGKWRYRAFIAGNKQFLKSYSAVLTITTY
jgi:hypothetical protein